MTKIMEIPPKKFWLIFLKDPRTGSISGTICGHNCVADYKKNPYYIGYKEIEVNMEELKR